MWVSDVDRPVCYHTAICHPRRTAQRDYRRCKQNWRQNKTVTASFQFATVQSQIYWGLLKTWKLETGSRQDKTVLSCLQLCSHRPTRTRQGSFVWSPIILLFLQHLRSIHWTAYHSKWIRLSDSLYLIDHSLLVGLCVVCAVAAHIVSVFFSIIHSTGLSASCCIAVSIACTFLMTCFNIRWNV